MAFTPKITRTKSTNVAKTSTNKLTEKTNAELTIDNAFAHISKVSLFNELYNIQKQKVNAKDLLQTVDSIVNEINNKYKLNIHETENKWFKDYLIKHIVNAAYYEIIKNTDDVKSILNNIKYKLNEVLDSALDYSVSKSPNQYVKKNLNMKIFKSIETIKIISKLDNISTQENKGKTRYNQQIVSLFDKNKLVKLIFQLSSQEIKKDKAFIELQNYKSEPKYELLSFNFYKTYKNPRNYHFNNLYKTYFYIVSDKVYKEYEEALNKTNIHYDTLSEREQSDFMKKFSTSNNSNKLIEKIAENVRKSIEEIHKLINETNDLENLD